MCKVGEWVAGRDSTNVNPSNFLNDTLNQVCDSKSGSSVRRLGQRHSSHFICSRAVQTLSLADGSESTVKENGILHVASRSFRQMGSEIEETT